MPDSRVTQLTNELRKGSDISAKLADLWPTSSPQALSNADSLTLANGVIKLADGMKTAAALRAYHISVLELRFLAKHLKKPKSSDPLLPVANIEKYCINYALRACEAELLDSSLSVTASGVAGETLQKLFEERNPGSKTTSTRKTKPKTPSRSRSRKENKNPQFPDGADGPGLAALFHGAETLGDDFLPRRESAIATSVILGAIAIRVSAKNDGLSLPQRLELARGYGVPWARHLGRFSDEDAKHAARKDAHIRKMKNGLLFAAKMPDCNPVHGLLARAYAVGMGKPTITEYAYTLLRVVNSFFRRKEKGKDGLTEKDEYGIISRVYQDSLFIFENIEVTASDWVHEDVSTLFDNIIAVETRATALGVSTTINKKSLARLLMQRSATLKGKKSGQCEVFAHAFQSELFSSKSYELLAMNSLDTALEIANVAMKGTLPDYLVNTETLFASHTLYSKPIKKHMCAKAALRLLRILEPFRKHICGRPNSLSEEESATLQVFVCATVIGLENTKCKCGAERKERLSDEDIHQRLKNMSVSALEALEKLLTNYLRKNDDDRIQACIRQLNALVSRKPYQGDSWEIWLFRRLYNAGREMYKNIKSASKKSRDGALTTLGETLVATSEWLSPDVCPDPGTKFEKHEQISDFANSLILATQCFIADSQSDLAITTCASKLMRSFFFEPSILQPELLPTATRMTFISTCAHVLGLVCDEAKIPMFIESISLGRPLTGHERNTLGRNVVLALSEHSLVLRHGPNAESLSVSRLIRSTVRARFEILSALKLTGKCMSLQVHIEWVQLLLEGVSIGKDGFKAKNTASGNLLSLNEITAETPKGGWTSNTITFDDGNSVNVELTPRLCRCSICSSDSFALLHILRDSWRLAVQRSPTLLREHLSRLERFLYSCDMKSLSKSLAMLSLDFLEWCQVMSILSSIDDHAGVMSKMIQGLKKRMQLSSSHDVGAIYASHGFLAGRPYYSALIDQDDRGDNRVSFFEKEEFMYTGCKADICLQNLELAKADELAKKCVALLLRKLKKHDDVESQPRTASSIGGIEVAIHGSIISTLDRTRALETLELIFALTRIGTTSLKMENFSDARYYLEKASIVSKELCGVESLLHLRQKSVLFQNKALSAQPETDVQSFLLAGSNEMAVRNEGEFDRTLLSNSYTVAADIALAACSADEFSNNRMIELGKLAAKFSGLALDVLHERRSTGHSNSNPDEREVNSVISTDVSLRAGQAELLLGNGPKAAQVFEKLKQQTKEQRPDIYLNALLGLASSIVRKLGGVEKVNSLLKPTKSRRGRKSKDMVAAEQVAKLLREAEDILDGSEWEPHSRMELFMLHAMVFGPSDTNMGLAWEIGNGFTLKWDARRRKLLEENCKRKDEDELVELVKEVHISPQKNKEHLSDMEKCRSLLNDMDIVVVGIALDPTNSHLIFWRLSATGFFTTTLPIPVTGEASYESICQRLTNVFKKMKENAVQAGDEFTEDQKDHWWEKTYKLDEEVGNVLQEVEEDWFGASSVLLLAASGDSKMDSNPDDHAAQAASALASIRVAYKHKVSEGFLAQAFEKLNICNESLDEVWDSAPGIKSSKSKVGNTVFILDSRIEHIPFESLPILRENKVGCTRVPSLQFLMQQLEAPPPRPNSKSVYYVLNPGGDLPRTEKKFRKVFEKRKGWKGLSGAPGESSRMVADAQRADVFLYCGHGGGEKYITPSALGRGSRVPVAVLMGCSSAKLTRHGGYRGSSGTPLEYLLNGSPAVVGNLWDVTDKDIDRLTAAFLKHWLGVTSTRNAATQSVADSLAIAREACRLPHLVGAATVAYGLPFL